MMKSVEGAKMMKSVGGLVSLICLLLAQIAVAQDAKEIVAKAEELLRANSSFSEVRMQVVKPDWSREFVMKTWAIEPDYALVLITEPAKEKGMVTLKREKEVWNWVPSVQRVIKIPPSMMLQPWMGSDFTNDDLVRESSIVEDYTHTIIGEETIDSYLCYTIQMDPKPESSVVWGKIIIWITKAQYLELKADYYDEDGVLVKTMTGTAIKELGGRLIPTWWEMFPLDQPEQKTVLEYRAMEFNVELDPNFFSEQNMKRVR